MLLNKNDFESGLQQDISQAHAFTKPSVGVPDAIPVLQMGNKSLFGPPQNYALGGAGFSSLPG